VVPEPVFLVVPLVALMPLMTSFLVASLVVALVPSLVVASARGRTLRPGCGRDRPAK
jgi:hypothetical protein